MNVRPSIGLRSRFMMPLIAYTWPAFSATRITGMKKNRPSVVPNWLKSGVLNVGTPTIEAWPMAPQSMWQADLASWQGGYTAETM